MVKNSLAVSPQQEHFPPYILIKESLNSFKTGKRSAEPLVRQIIKLSYLFLFSLGGGN